MISTRAWATLAAFIAFTLLGRILFRLQVPSDGIELIVAIPISAALGTVAVWKALGQK